MRLGGTIAAIGFSPGLGERQHVRRPPSFDVFLQHLPQLRPASEVVGMRAWIATQTLPGDLGAT